MSQTYVAIDTETTGLEPGSRLVELAGVHLTQSGFVIGEMHTLVNPGMPIPRDVVCVHGIDDAHVRHGLSTIQALRSFLDWILPSSILVAHNAGFDWNVLAWEAQRVGLSLPRFRFVDTLDLSRAMGPSATSHCLSSLVDRGMHHRALADARSVGSLFCELAQQARGALALPRSRRLRAEWRYPKRLPKSLKGFWRYVALGLSADITLACGRKHRFIPLGAARTWSETVLHGYSYEQNERVSFLAHEVQTLDRSLRKS